MVTDSESDCELVTATFCVAEVNASEIVIDSERDCELLAAMFCVAEVNASEMVTDSERDCELAVIALKSTLVRETSIALFDAASCPFHANV